MKKFLASTMALIAGLALCIMPANATRTNISSVLPPALLSGTPGAGTLALSWTAADTVNQNQCDITGKEVLLAWNTDAVTAYTVTVNSVPDPQLGRSGDITSYSIPAGTVCWIGPMPTVGWQQSNGKLYFQANNAAVKFAVVKIQGQPIYR
jgi:hypothetical protein